MNITSTSGGSGMTATCAECARKDAVIADLARALAAPQTPLSWPPTVMPTTTAPQISRTFCGCSPLNGGSGICGCTLSGATITCTLDGA